MNVKILFRLALLLPLLASAGGCATRVLWSGDALNKWNAPARQPNLCLYQARGQDDFLIVYNELSERRDVIRPRAYFLRRNQGRIDHNQPPEFIDPTNAIGLKAVPIFFQTNAPMISVPPFPRAVAGAGEQSFDLISGGQIIGSYQLPAYKEGFGNAERLAITPLAAAADLTIVGGVVVYWVAVGVARSGSASWSIK